MDRLLHGHYPLRQACHQASGLIRQFGNLVAADCIDVQVPERLSREEKELYERLRSIGSKEGWNFKKMWK